MMPASALLQRQKQRQVQSKDVINPELLNAHAQDANHVLSFATLREYQDLIKWSIKITDHFTCTSACIQSKHNIVAKVQATYYYGAKWSPVQ